MQQTGKATPRLAVYDDGDGKVFINRTGGPEEVEFARVLASFERPLEDAKRDAALIVKAVNAHDDLVEALRDSVDVLVGHTYASVVKQAYEKAIAALAKAEGA